MSTPYIGEIRLFAGNFAPSGWAMCDGSLLSIAANQSLYQLIGTTYGGDGTSTFALPDLRSRVPVHQGAGSSGTTYSLGEAFGVEAVTLSTSEIPSHSHVPQASAAAGTSPDPSGQVWAASTAVQQFASPGATVAMAPAIQPAGAGQAHDNMLPFVALTFIIALQGTYPTQA